MIKRKSRRVVDCGDSAHEKPQEVTESRRFGRLRTIPSAQRVSSLAWGWHGEWPCLRMDLRPKLAPTRHIMLFAIGARRPQLPACEYRGRSEQVRLFNERRLVRRDGRLSSDTLGALDYQGMHLRP